MGWLSESRKKAQEGRLRAAEKLVELKREREAIRADARARHQAENPAWYAANEALAQARGYETHEDMKRGKRLKKSGARWCPSCERNVRPVPPWGFTRIITLSLITPGKLECPTCKGTLFTPPRV